MTRPNKDSYYLNIAKAVASRSTCLKRQYGCVIVNNDEIIATGYNGSPRGKENCCEKFTECPRRLKPSNGNNYDDCQSVHAEQNAIISASRGKTIGATMYLWGREYDYDKKEWHPINTTDFRPCKICGRMMINAGINRLVIPYGPYNVTDIVTPDTIDIEKGSW